MFYLSQDLRVFSSTAGATTVPVVGGPTFGTDSVQGAYDYIKALLVYLNGSAQYTSGSANPLLDGSSRAGKRFPGRFFGDSHGKRKEQLQLCGRARETEGHLGDDHGAAESECLLPPFRLAESGHGLPTVHNLSSAPDTSNLPGSPQVGAGDTTIPFFAQRQTASPTCTDSTGGANTQNVEITSGDTAWYFFGCFIDVYDPNQTIGGQQVQHYLAGTHHCLVAQIGLFSAYSDDICGDAEPREFR